jgi:hypothetical protein
VSTPICPRTLAPIWRFGNEATNEDLARARYPEAAPCTGSRCALWVPEVHANKGGTPSGIGPRGEGSVDSTRLVDRNDNPGWWRGEPTGNGWCAENLRRPPWADPAKPEGK